MEIRAATAGDAAALAALHMRYLPHGESDFTQLGAAIVERFYRNALARGIGACFCAVENDAIGAFVLVTGNVRDLFTNALLAGPSDVVKFLTRADPRGLFGAVRSKLSSNTIVLPAVPEVVYLIVGPVLRGRRLGGLLLERADEWFRAEGLRYFELTSHADNEAALKIYEGHGMRVVREYVKDGVRNYRFAKDV